MRRRVFKTPLLAAALLSLAGASRAQSMSGDFKSMSQWLSHEISQGLAFNAGSTFDPPREIVDRRLAPDVSLGVGAMPLAKEKFPVMQTQPMADLGPAKFFPSSVKFPNMAVHLRAGLPWRSDAALRFANMTTPPGYKISPTTTGVGQSNSAGVSLRRHLMGHGKPLLTLGAHFNHVWGRFHLNTKAGIDQPGYFQADTAINGGIWWNVNSYGLNAVVSETYGIWTPFIGVGYNYVTGSVRSRLEAYPKTFLVDNIIGEASDHPEQNQARLIIGGQMARSWVNLFANGEIKTIGINSGKEWIFHMGLSLPFHIGARSAAAKARDEAQIAARKTARPRLDPEGRQRRAENAVKAARESRKELFGGPVKEQFEGAPTMIFIQ